MRRRQDYQPPFMAFADTKQADGRDDAGEDGDPDGDQVDPEGRRFGLRGAAPECEFRGMGVGPAADRVALRDVDPRTL